MRISVAIATVGRPEIVALIVDSLRKQTRVPDDIIVVGAAQSDLLGLEAAHVSPVLLLSEMGLCRQRNAALEWASSRSDIIVFFDDDFIAHPDYLRNVEIAFNSDAVLAGATGWLIADGAKTGSISFEDGSLFLGRADIEKLPDDQEAKALYGCNMAIRLKAACGLRFDEKLPLYGWLEDIDFTYQLSSRGQLLRSRRFSGVHMGVKGGRTSGIRLGYSQIANVAYLYKKGTMQQDLGLRLLMQNFSSNAVHALRPEPHIDRRGRLKGNLLAFRDLALGRAHPERVLEL